jgi:hypothetical protein
MTTEELAKRRAWAAIHFNQPNLTEAELDSGVFMPSENFSDGWDNGAEWALSSQWISVDEQLPEEKKAVLCYMPDMKDNYAEKDMYFDMAILLECEFVNLDAEVIHPSHWMPIPIPQLNPEKEEK